MGVFAGAGKRAELIGGGRGIRQTYYRKGVGKESRAVRYTVQIESRKKTGKKADRVTIKQAENYEAKRQEQCCGSV